jgi:ATP-dependent exoDNAse (exonuclease V) beta subunit
MSKPAAPFAPPDQLERQRALDSGRSILVQAPAGSGKTDLLTRRFLRLLAEVEEPSQVVAITFTNSAAAEMRHRILAELEKAAASPAAGADEFSMDSLARRALAHSRQLGWNLLDLPAQLRVRTIDSFCRELALQQPLLSGFGGGLEIAEQPEELYRRAARQTLKKIDQTGSALGAAVEELLVWRDNGWQEMENLLVEMLNSRDRWMHGFVLEGEPAPEDPNPEALRERLERPFARAAHAALIRLSQLLDRVPGARAEALNLARFGCEQSEGQLHRELAELVEFPAAPFIGSTTLEEARQAHANLAELLLTGDGVFRKQVDKRLGFPADRKREKARLLDLIASLAVVPGLESALAAVRNLPSAGYTEEEWKIVRCCFTLLRQAAAELQIAFAEAGRVDYIEVAQIAQRVLRGEDGLPTDAALAVSDGIRHLLVDEFQDTSRRQHQLLSSLIAAWPEREGRSCFVVGDPMQSIYFFRDADAELFPRVQLVGLEIPHEEPLLFDFVSLKANFRTAPRLVEGLNEAFEQIFAGNDGSGVSFSSAQPVREEAANAGSPFTLHLDFIPQTGRGSSADPEAAREKEAARTRQIAEIVDLIRGHQSCIAQARQARERGEEKKFRIAVLGRAKNHLIPIAEALREAEIPFRAVELEKLAARPEVLDALALARALLNPQDRVAWLGVLRAPWCGLSLDDLHRLAGDLNGDPALLTRSVPELVAERLPLLSEAGRPAAARVLDAQAAASALRALRPTASVGSWLEAVWLRVGGAACVDATARANLNLLWSCLDRLPGGEPDLLGPALDAALDKLTALPDPAASSDCGVQLMTIHKSKGLEFEVVIVPELQAANGSGGRKMLSWLERGLEGGLECGLERGLESGLEYELEQGLAEPGESEEITEFLIAPFQRKGGDKGSAKAWVDRVYREREWQEARRILYVAATRAREELHFFARPACKQRDGEFTLAEPANSLLVTAWPALEEEVRARFKAWKIARSASEARAEQPETREELPGSRGGKPEIRGEQLQPYQSQQQKAYEGSRPGEHEGQEIESIAASGEGNLFIMPSPIRPTLLRRLPLDYRPPPAPIASQQSIASQQEDAEPVHFPEVVSAPPYSRFYAERVGDHEAQAVFPSEGAQTAFTGSEAGFSGLYDRHEGSLLSRALGTAVHALLEELARLRAGRDWEATRLALRHFEPRIAAQVRATGVDRRQAERIAAEALKLALDASQDPIGAWILSPHLSAASEAGWAGVAGGPRAVRTVRVDRVFQAGPEPCAEGEDCWWVIDYKTAHADHLDPTQAKCEFHALFAPQVEAYAQLLRNLRGDGQPIMGGLYYPRLSLLDWWQM